MKKFFNFKLFLDELHRKGLNEYKFSQLSKISPTTIHYWRNVKTIKKFQHRESIERILGVKYDDLCVSDGPIKSNVTYLGPIPKMLYWPVVGKASAGPWIQTIDNQYDLGEYDDYMPVDKALADPNGYSIILQGDSMAPAFLEGDRLAVSPNREIQSGKYGLVFINDSKSEYRFDVVFKRVFFVDSAHVILRSLNPDYPPIEKTIGPDDGQIAKIHPVCQMVRKNFL